jgi:hypothetical protein
VKKRVLIISAYFAPQNAIGAVRPTKLAKYLTRMGNAVTVLCGADPGGLRPFACARPCGACGRAAGAGAKPAGLFAPAQACAPGERPKARAVRRLRRAAVAQAADRRFTCGCTTVRTRLSPALRADGAGLNGHYDAVAFHYGPLSVHTARER